MLLYRRDFIKTIKKEEHTMDNKYNYITGEVLFAEKWNISAILDTIITFIVELVKPHIKIYK